MTHLTTLKAFTLVELMVVIGLMSVLAVGVNTYFISSLRSARKAATVSIVKNEGEQIQADIVYATKFAKRINSCSSTSINLLAGDGSTIIYSITGTNLNKNTNPPDPLPVVSINLNSTKTIVSNGGECLGTAFNCVGGGKTVDMCLYVSSANAGDVTEATSMTFKSYIYNDN